MVYVRLAQDWTDPSGNAHSAGDMVDVDAATLATLEANGVVAESGASPAGGWVGPSGGGGTGGGGGGGAGGAGTDGGWVGPSSRDDD